MMFCGNCGAPLKEGAKFCPQCGTPVKTETLPEVIPAAGNEIQPVTPPAAPPAKRFKRSSLVMWACGILLVCGLGFGVSQLFRISMEPCDWCGRTPTLSYQLSSGGYAYICKNCRTHCMLCGRRATRHHENLLGTMVFLCSDCDRELQEVYEAFN